MQVEMAVCVDVIERKAGGAKGRKLRADLQRQLAPPDAAAKNAYPMARRLGGKAPVTVDERRDPRAGERRRPLDEHDVQPNAQPGKAPCAPDGVGRGGCRDHQACRGQDADAVGPLHRLVDLEAETEIVGRDDEPVWPVPRHAFEAAPARRSRRNWKNSMPSRSRRRIISGLRTISPTMAAILPLRK